MRQPLPQEGDQGVKKERVKGVKAKKVRVRVERVKGVKAKSKYKCYFLTTSL